MDNLNNGPIGRPLIPDSRCAICFDDITNTCYTNACLHLFCFVCLQRWSNSDQTCPLCKKTFNNIYHSFGDLGGHETYTVRIIGSPQCSSPRTPRCLINNVRPSSEMPNGNRMFGGMNSVVNINHGNERMMSTLWSVYYNRDEVDDNYDQIYHYPSQNYPLLSSQRPILGQAMRIQVYIDNLWAEPLPDTTGRYRYYSPAFYRENPTQMYRLHKFVLRDVVAIRQLRLEDDGQSLPFPGNTDINVTNMIMRSLADFGIRQLHLVNNLRPFLDTCAVHFCHELYNFAISPNDISVYDRNVRYNNWAHDSEFTAPSYQEPSLPIHVVGETVALESDNVEVRVNNYDEILSHSLRSINLHNSASIGQPFTSSGIQGLLDRPTENFESEHGVLP